MQINLGCVNEVLVWLTLPVRYLIRSGHHLVLAQESQLALALTELVKAPIMLLNSRRGTGVREVEAAAFRQVCI